MVERSGVDEADGSTVGMAFAPEEVGAKIGRYKILEKIGEGGFGVVYVAEQKEPVKRRVALKVIKLGMDTRQVVARFEAERQALALMDHPNIARVLDAGATESGRPYFVMELVRGVKITEYCDQNKLATKERVELFIQVCNAIQHAHQKGIIHRDIKPSNILVTLHDGVPVPKVIDFGIAKATQQDLTDKTVYTQLQQFIGTPAYMSPEQAEMSGLDVDTRSDIYSLGVLLYELLTGSTPFDGVELMKSGVEGMRKTIREKEPPRPSTKVATLQGEELTTTAARRSAEGARLVHVLRGDLDWIAMKCLEKDRTRRYETANGLAVDLKRHLSNEPVSARPPSRVYRLQKAMRRNKLGVMAGAVVLGAILAGLGLATVGFFRAREERDRAQAAMELANDNFKQARAAVEDVLWITNERLRDAPGLQQVRLELTKAAIDRYEPFLAKPIADPTPRAELARLYAHYGLQLLEQSEEFNTEVMAAFEKARSIQEELLKEHPGDRGLRSDLGWTCILEEWRWHAMSPTAEEAGKKAVAIFRQLVAEDPRDPFACDDLVWALWRLGALRNIGVGNPGAENIAVCKEAVQRGAELVREYPASVEFRRELANAMDAEVSVVAYAAADGMPAEEELRTSQRSLEMRERNLADFEAGKPESRLPARPRNSEGSMIPVSMLWLKWDVAFGSQRVGRWYAKLERWKESAEMNDRAAKAFMDLLEHNPSLFTVAEPLGMSFDGRINAAMQLNQRERVEEWSKQSVAFWNRLVQEHPDLPQLLPFLDDALKKDAEVGKWAATQPAER